MFLGNDKNVSFESRGNIHVNRPRSRAGPGGRRGPGRGPRLPISTTARKRQSGEIRKLTSLLDVSQALASPANLKSAFHRVLEILERYHGTGRSVIALPREDGRRLYLHASIGIRAPHADAPLGGTLAQQVFESGRPLVVPRVSQEPALAAHVARPVAPRNAKGPRDTGAGAGSKRTT